jgi:hypothetical protein
VYFTKFVFPYALHQSVKIYPVSQSPTGLAALVILEFPSATQLIDCFLVYTALPVELK